MIELKNISKTFETKDGKVEALKDIAIKINERSRKEYAGALYQST